MKTRYDTYRLSLKELLSYSLAGLLAYSLGSLLLYDSLWPLLLFPPVLAVYLKLVGKYCAGRRRRKLLELFLPAAEAFVVALRAGYSAETALRESRKDIQRLAGKEQDMVKELLYMENQMGVSVPLEQLFLDLARRSGLEDVEDFAQVFAAGKRTGGDLDGILSRTIGHMKQKQETRRDIEAEVASRQMEQRIMSLVPWGILLYLRLTSPTYMAVLYEGLIGRVVMTVCLGIYLVSWFWGKKITDIQV